MYILDSTPKPNEGLLFAECVIVYNCLIYLLITPTSAYKFRYI